MRYHFATLALAPLLILQGRYVHRVTPRLPEPDGLRAGSVGTGKALRLLVVGDSAAAGVGAATQAEALTGQLVSALAAHFTVTWRLVAKTGFTTLEVIKLLADETADVFDIAVTSTGVNDVTSNIAPQQWLTHQRELIALLADKFQTRHIMLSSLPPMQFFSALPQPLRWYLGQRAQRLNSVLQGAVADQSRCEFVATQFQPQPSLLASDGFHPSADAYTLWAEQLAQRIKARW